MKLKLILLSIILLIPVNKLLAQIGSAIVYLKSDSVIHINIDKVYISGFVDHQGNGIPYIDIDSLITPDSVIVNHMLKFILKMKIDKRTNEYFISEIVPTRKITPQKNNIHNQTKDVVYLKNGSVVRGDIVEQILNKSVKVQTADGSIIVYNMSEIEKIKKDTIVNSQPNIALRQSKVAFGLEVCVARTSSRFTSGSHTDLFGAGACVLIPTSSNSVGIIIGGDYLNMIRDVSLSKEDPHVCSIYAGPKYGEELGGYFLPAVSVNFFDETRYGFYLGGGVLFPLESVKLHLGAKIGILNLLGKKEYEDSKGIIEIFLGVVL